MSRKRIRLNILSALLLLLVAFCGSAIFGNAHIGLLDFGKVVASRLPFIGQWVDTTAIPDAYFTIVFNLRLPRILLALFAGAGLAVAGAVFQGVFANPMAEPYLLGVSSGAALGATLASVLEIQIRFIGFGTVGIFAFAGAMAVMVVIFKMSVIKGEASVSILLLAGLAINYFLSAVISILMTFNHDKMEEVYFWTMGSFKNASWEKVVIVSVVVVVVCVYLFRYNRELDIIMLGDEQAKSLGVPVDQIKKKLLFAASFMAAIIVASSGIIGFVGLIIPHSARFLSGPSHRRLMPIAMIIGAIFLILADTLARSLIQNMEISTGIITSLFGIPFFLGLLYRNRKTVS